MTVQLNPKAFEYAMGLIRSGRVSEDLHGDWSDVDPSRAAQNQFVADHGYEAYALWHLGIDPDDNPETKGAYSFPYGDFSVLYRSGVIAAEERAAQRHHVDIQQAAKRLLESLPAE